GSTLLLRTRHRAAGPDAPDDAPPRRRLRGADGSDLRRGRQRHHDRRGGRQPAAPAVLRLGQARPALHGRAGGLPPGGAGAPRDDRAPVHPGRPAQAEDRHRPHGDAQRLRRRPVAQERDGLRHHRDPGAPFPGRARGRHGPRADPHRQPRRGDHDPGELLRLARVDDRPVRLLLRRRLRPQRRRRQPQRGVPRPHLARGLRRLVLPHAGPLALPRVRGRPRRRGHHGPPVRAVQRAHEDLERHGPDPADGPAPERARGVLHLPPGRQEGDRRALRHAPADGEAHRGPQPPRDAAAGRHRGGPHAL
ncbi:MAG: Heat shock protein HtpX, partial [uncultured Solirubrobacteraceae bacterium]